MAKDTRPLTIEKEGGLFDDRFDPKMNLAQRMHLVMTRLDYIQKDKKDGMKYTIVSHDKVTAMVREHTVACGIIYFPQIDRVERDGNLTLVQLRLVYVNIDNPEDTFEVSGLGYGVDPGDKGPGKAISYAVKYCQLKAFGLETGDDPDLDQEVKARTTLQQKADELEKAMQLAADDGALRRILTEPSTELIFASLKEQAPADYRHLHGQVSLQAKRVGLDLKTLKD